MKQPKTQTTCLLPFSPAWKVSYNNIEVYVGKVTIVLYWPTIKISSRFIHFGLPSEILYQDKRNWAWNKSFVLRAIGFGIGIAHNHCENPNYEKPNEQN